MDTELHFSCLSCTSYIGVTVQCMAERGAASTLVVRVPCPTCGSIQKVYFTPEQGVERVEEQPEAVRQVPEPSVN